MSIEFTDEQLHLKQEMRSWLKVLNKPYFYYSGAAGTGKTTVIKSFLSDMGLSDKQVISAAYVGKAVLVLLRHGLRACTIHSLIYNVVFVKENKEYVDEDGNIRVSKKTKMKFMLKEKLDDEIVLIIIDEAGQVNDALIADILSFGIPVIFLGDHNQLPPVIGKSSILDNPDFILTKIMRQEEGNFIVYLSQCILKDIPVDYGTYGKSRVIDSIDIDKNIIRDYDIILCAKNKTRDMLNTEIRKNVLQTDSLDPLLYDKMICRQNNWDECVDGIFLTNGIVGHVTNIDYSTLHKGALTIDFKPDFMSDSFIDIALDYKYLKTPYDERINFGLSRYNKFEYAYAITTHLSQGSEYDNVLFMDEWFHDAELTRRIRYTAVTRAKESITYIKSRPKRNYMNYYNY